MSNKDLDKNDKLLDRMCVRVWDVLSIGYRLPANRSDGSNQCSHRQ